MGSYISRESQRNLQEAWNGILGYLSRLGDYRRRGLPGSILLAWEQCQSLVSYCYSGQLVTVLTRDHGAPNVGPLGENPSPFVIF